MLSTFKNRRILRVVALIMSVVMIITTYMVTSVPVLSADVNDTAEPYITLDGERVSSVILEENAKLRLEVVSEYSEVGYCWQIEDPLEEDRWINVSGSLTEYLWVTYALVGSMVKPDGTVALRCCVTSENSEYYTQPVTVSVSYNVTSKDNSTIPEVLFSSADSMLAEPKANEDFTTVSIVINYLFDNNAIAFEPYGASVAKGSDFSASVPSPSVVGYAPFRRVDEDYVDASVVEIDLKNVQDNVTINVIYEPALVNFSVHHHLQNLLDDDYSIHYDLITNGKALTGSVVGDGLALTEEQLPGFKALAYEKLTVAADGSTVIEIRYDRNYYLVDFDMNGGYGSEPVYTRYGATVGANDPIRHGYVFDGWELMSYGGETPTDEQKSMYEISHDKTIIVPAANLRYRARWITQETEYTVVFWKENANDDGYSYWGYLDGRVAMSGSHVNGQDLKDLIKQVDGIDDEQYFTFNSQKSDKNVLVEGDGSTVVNLYYTRNYFTLTFKAKGLCTIPEDHTHGDACYKKVCDLGHTHTAECVPELICTVEEHPSHTEECIICGIEEHVHGTIGCDCTIAEHSHTVNCWRNIGSLTTGLTRAPASPKNGQIYRYSSRYYIYVNGSWYRYNGWGVTNNSIVDPSCSNEEHTHGTDCNCDKDEHAHSDSCFKDTLHTHNDSCYKYSCGAIEHVHTTECNRLICGITENHSHSSTCRSSSGTNTVKTVYRKYQQSLEDLWPVTDDNGVIYDDGQRWSPSSSSYYSNVLVYIAKMPPDDFTLTLNTASYETYTMHYYLEVLPGESYDKVYDGRYYALDKTIKAIYNYITKAEDFFDITGFEQYESDPAFSNNQYDAGNSSIDVNFYYNRITDHHLEFKNNGTVLEDKSVAGIMFGARLESYNFEPPYPDNLEPNAYSFAGWYTTPQCFAGTEVDWENITMPEGDLLLYAKWAPITHTVRVFKDATLTEQIGSDQIVDHKAFAYAPSGYLTNGNYVFQGWFYMDNVNGVPTEKAFVFNGIPILEDMNIYAKWSSHVSVEYKINYKLHNTDIDIAEPTVGSAIAGHNKTFSAKAGDELYSGYQTGYYPLTNSHTITMSVDGTHEFTFYYVYVETMPYKVQYINSVTGQKLCDDLIVMDNSLSVVTETFKRFDKMMPDAYQKRLVLSADDSSVDENGIYASNVITFYYNSDEEHAYYRVVHYIQNMAGDTYREYRSEETVGVIGTEYTINAIMLTGFNFVGGKTKVNGALTPTSGTTVTATLGGEGMLIELYYDRQTVNYTVRYLDSNFDDIVDLKHGSGVFGEPIVEYAPSLDHLGYELVSDTVKTHTLSANAEHNVIEFLYQEKTVSLKYKIIGPAGCGTLSRYSENVSAISGNPEGSLPTVSEGFVFIGWFTDEACTQAVDSVVIGQNNLIKPTKNPSEVWSSVTYYAKYSALETDLTIETRSTDASDTNQAFIFNIKGKAGTDTEDINITVTIIGNGTTTITKLPTGDYTVTELTDWSWRYENSTAAREITLEYNDGAIVIIFDNSRENGQWLDGNSVKNNLF